MSIDLLYGLLPEHILLVLLLSLMVLEIFRVNRRLAGLSFTVALAAACGVLVLHLVQGYDAVVVPGEIVVDSFAVISRLVILGCG
nr:NADH-quinone oxidoreductase subunit N [Desulfuromonadales bacterium]NIS41199.1 NADH-quinone oxidoreductase subunit N [Desulfuromonadales bacterium]